MLQDGWYLMSTTSLVRLLEAFRRGDETYEADDIEPLPVADALAFRNAGNLPDDQERTLRLVLRVDSKEDLHSLDERRLALEPDYLDPPAWRREGSKPVNVVPLRAADVKGTARPWWDDPAAGALESEWQAAGVIDGVIVPGEFRSFIFKSVIALRQAGKPVTSESILGALERWLTADQVEEIREAFRRAEEDAPGG
jgi:hypothetical protein